MNQLRSTRFRMVLVGILLWAAVPAMADEPGLKTLSFLPQWLPQAQFAGYYMALHKGFYRARGLEVNILQGGPARSPMTCLRENKTDIASLWLSSALQLADQGVDVVNVGQILQRSALVLVAKRAGGIRSPEEMNGKKIGLWPADFQIQPKAFFDKFHLKVEIVTTESPVNLFLRDGVQLASLMWYNEYHSLINSGLDPRDMTLFFFNDFDLNFPEDGIYLRRETFEKDPAAACAFVCASLEGWRYAFAHSEETLDLLISMMTAAHVPANRGHQRWMLERMHDLMQPVSGAQLAGLLQPGDYRRVGDILLTNGLIRAVPPYDSFFRGCETHD